jgi:hypothetical protein
MHSDWFPYAVASATALAIANVQTWESDPYDTSIEAADPNLLASTDFQHAKEQLIIGQQAQPAECQID